MGMGQEEAFRVSRLKTRGVWRLRGAVAAVCGGVKCRGELSMDISPQGCHSNQLIGFNWFKS